MGQVRSTLKAVNILFAPVAKRGRRRVDSGFDELVAAAEDEAGFGAEGFDDFLDGFRLLLREYAADPNATFMGMAGMTRDVIRGLIVNRLRVARIIAERPEIEDEPIEAPIVVTGLPRTATTLAHHLLAYPEGNRAPTLWELRHTLPADADPELRKAPA